MKELLEQISTLEIHSSGTLKPSLKRATKTIAGLRARRAFAELERLLKRFRHKKLSCKLVKRQKNNKLTERHGIQPRLLTKTACFTGCPGIYGHKRTASIHLL